MNYDVIVIGGGLGGLTAGAKLAKEGRKVLLLEQHDRPGGCATTFRRKDYTMEVGLHEMDGPDPRDMKNRIFRDLGVSGEVTFLKVPEFFRFINDRYDFTMPHDPVQAADNLIKEFPGEEEGIRAYFDRIMNAKKYIRETADEPESNLGEYLDSIIGNEDLKLILLGNLGYFHDDPYTLSLNYYAVAQGSYFSGGGSFIQGGSQVLSDFLSGVIRNNGGEVLLKHRVTDLILEGDRITGVKYAPTAGSGREPGGESDAGSGAEPGGESDVGSDTEPGGESGASSDPGAGPASLEVHDGNTDGGQASLEAYGSDIILNGPIPSLMNFNLPGEWRQRLKKEVEAREIGASLLTVYFGFDRPLQELGSTNYSYFLYDPSVKSQADILENNRGPFETKSFTFVDYGAVDSRLAPEGKSVGAVCCIDYTARWEGLSREEYRKEKEKVAQIFIGKLETLIPGFADAVEFCEVGTSKTVERYTLNPGGAVYGFAQSPGRARMQEIPAPPNLHYASAWTKIGGGFSGAIFSGYMCAFRLLRGAGSS
jgi:phytoene dehydrogenase-like protein